MKFTEAERKINLEKNWLLQKISNTNNFITKSEFFWIIDYKNKETSEKIIVPKNFITDFGSIPRFLWWFFDKTRFVSYILHDFLYSKKYYWNLNRKESDKILKEALKVEWMGFFKRNLVYFGVRIFWKKFFRKS